MQRTWLDPRRPAKAGGAVPRKALERSHGLAVRFGTPDGRAPLFRRAARGGGQSDGQAELEWGGIP
ncbi:MAG: hypothetical protein OXI75_05515 [Rhodospirillales bacterium]|nr:hypothetical protein [Rhodospirillales bacterium]